MIDPADRFIRGYLLRPTVTSCAATKGWPALAFGPGQVLETHPRTDVQIRNDGSGVLALIGRAYDADSPQHDLSQIADALAEALRTGGRDGLIGYAAWLGGRFVVLVADGAGLLAVPDCAATLALHYRATPDGLHAASHWTLTAESAQAGPEAAAIEFMNSPEYVSSGGKYYPGLWTPYDGVRTLIANNALWFDPVTGVARQRRFYPSEALPARSALTAQAEFKARLAICCRLSLGARNALSLTGGDDSQATLTTYGSLGPALSQQLTAFTYIRPATPDRAQFDDVFAASRTALKAGVQHLVFAVEPVDYASDFHKWYAASFPRGARYPSLARAYYENLPADCTILISTVAEIGTVFYKERSVARPTPETLAAKFTPSAAKNSPALLATMTDYIAETNFQPERFSGIDWHDLFYWEHRNSKWASLWYAEVDMTGFAIVPYNDRRLIEIMLSLPVKEREDKVLQRCLTKSGGRNKAESQHSLRSPKPASSRC